MKLMKLVFLLAMLLAIQVSIAPTNKGGKKAPLTDAQKKKAKTKRDQAKIAKKNKEDRLTAKKDQLEQCNAKRLAHVEAEDAARVAKAAALPALTEENILTLVGGNKPLATALKSALDTKVALIVRDKGQDKREVEGKMALEELKTHFNAFKKGIENVMEVLQGYIDATRYASQNNIILGPGFNCGDNIDFGTTRHFNQHTNKGGSESSIKVSAQWFVTGSPGLSLNGGQFKHLVAAITKRSAFGLNPSTSANTDPWESSAKLNPKADGIGFSLNTVESGRAYKCHFILTP